MRSLEELYAPNNSLTEQLPAVWFSTTSLFPRLRKNDFRWNKLHGQVPELGAGKSLQQVKMYVVPMDNGSGLCGPSPVRGPLLWRDDLQWNVPQHVHDGDPEQDVEEHGFITGLPSCPAGKEPHNSVCKKTIDNPAPTLILAHTILMSYSFVGKIGRMRCHLTRHSRPLTLSLGKRGIRNHASEQAAMYGKCDLIREELYCIVGLQRFVDVCKVSGPGGCVKGNLDCAILF